MAKNPQPLPKYVTDLINTYTTAQQSLLNTISTKKAKGNVIAYQQDLLKQVDIEIRKLNLYAISWANGNLPTEYRNGVDNVNRFLEGIGQPTQNYNQFAQLHNRAVSVLVQNATDDLINANNFVGRKYKDNIRQSTIDAITQKIATGANIRDTRNDIMNRLISTNADGVRTRNGRLINLRSYAETVARSTTREATNTATLNHLSAGGRDLVKMSSHNSPCKVCAPLEGRVYSISGKNKEYPPLSKAYSGTHANIHPNCRHVLVPYIESLAEDPTKDKEFSNKPFDTDPRSQADIDNYNNSQKYKADLNRDRKQWQRYKMVMPNETPKTLSGFRTSKKSNSENFKKLQSNYRSVRRGV